MYLFKNKNDFIFLEIYIFKMSDMSKDFIFIMLYNNNFFKNCEKNKRRFHIVDIDQDKKTSTTYTLKNIILNMKLSFEEICLIIENVKKDKKLYDYLFYSIISKISNNSLLQKIIFYYPNENYNYKRLINRKPFSTDNINLGNLNKIYNPISIH